VLEILSDEETLTVVGETADLCEGEEIRALGSFVTHPSYGRQFRAESFERILPATSSAILRYLSGGAVKGVGPVLAKRLVEAFGDKTLAIMESDPSILSKIKGISPSKASSIADEYRKVLGIRSIMAFLTDHGIPPSASIAVYKRWGAMAQDVISCDPFCLCDNDIKIPFEQADQIAASLGFSYDDPCRLKGGLLYVLSHNLQNGHACLPLDKLCLAAASLLQASSEQLQDALYSLVESKAAVSENIGTVDYIYLPEMYSSEKYIADRLSLMLSLANQDRLSDTGEIADLEKIHSIRYAKQQREAIIASMQYPIMILTGGPGTGKTTTLNGIITLFERRGMKVALCAPTGRAAKRLSEVTNREASTIHRLLEVDFLHDAGEVAFKRNERNPLRFDAVVVDEMSMVDSSLFSSLLKAVKTGSRLILVGTPTSSPR
jgi:exodeoxyribonuclease V alpha subunit